MHYSATRRTGGTLTSRTWPANKDQERARGRCVVINPQQPRGAVLSKETLPRFVDLAKEHDLILFSDEIYEKITYDDAEMIDTASLTGEDVLCLTFSGLSKAYRVAGYRSGWLADHRAQLACGVLPGGHQAARQHAHAARTFRRSAPSQTALGGLQSINDLILPGGRSRPSGDIAHRKLNEIDRRHVRAGPRCAVPVPKLDVEKLGSWTTSASPWTCSRSRESCSATARRSTRASPDHFRLVTLPAVDMLDTALDRLGKFL
ncbi:aminotransferase class I/II-fold pyridoxal phosphate-dependent enzyme [Kocuria rhizophila]|nr:aminotransferase class I/II-fold pyridoxal phosphate-dependent enzyme [Kocuria rhizophila]